MTTKLLLQLAAAAVSDRGPTLMDEAHYDTPWEFLHRTASFPPRDRPYSDSSEALLAKAPKDLANPRGSKSSRLNETSHQLSCDACNQVNLKLPTNPRNIRQRTTQAQATSSDDMRRASSTDLERSSRFKFGIGRLRVERTSNSAREPRKSRYREDEIIHKGIDRVIAERKLTDHDVGAFLIRVRDNGTLALSIRANNGVLHIKLELRNGRWVLGEGPSFGSIASIINFYRCHELPIRGADRMLLNKPILVTSSQHQSPFL